jgi:hypothetical protein
MAVENLKGRALMRLAGRLQAGTTTSGNAIRPVSRGSRRAFALISLAAFALYWYSSVLVEHRGGTTHFGADAWIYAELAKGDVFGRMVDGSLLSRIFRFHTTTLLLAAGWMRAFGFLSQWIDPLYILKGMFALVGAAGVWAAMSALAEVVPRGQAVLWGLVYAVSLDVWYFSSIEESKIVSATLIGLYIATYLRLRRQWTLRGALLLKAILFFACLNEIVACFLVILPVIDAFARRGWDVLKSRWIAWHGLVAPVAFAMLEGIRRFWPGAAGTQPEGASHLSMFFYNLAKNDYSAEALHTFVVRWFFFNVAAPEPHGNHWANPAIRYGGDFQPLLSSYFSSPASAALVAVAGVILIACLFRRRNGPRVNELSGLLPALLAYALLRAAFFFIFDPDECLLFSSSVTLAHMLMIAVPFAASRLPAKPAVLTAFAVLLFVTNGAFIAGYYGLAFSS